MKAVLVALALLVVPMSGVAAPASPAAQTSQVVEKEEKKGGGFPWVTFLILFVLFGGLTAFRKKENTATQADNGKAQ